MNNYVVFAKAKEKGILRAFQVLLNNEFLQSFTFIPIPTSSEDLRELVFTNFWHVGMLKRRLIAFARSSTC